jgi:hypothetical protein
MKISVIFLRISISFDEKDENRLVELRYYNVAIKKHPFNFTRVNNFFEIMVDR